MPLRFLECQLVIFLLDLCHVVDSLAHITSYCKHQWTLCSWDDIGGMVLLSLFASAFMV